MYSSLKSGYSDVILQYEKRCEIVSLADIQNTELSFKKKKNSLTHTEDSYVESINRYIQSICMRHKFFVFINEEGFYYWLKGGAMKHILPSLSASLSFWKI